MNNLLSQFKKTFIRAIGLEMEALKARLGSFDLQIIYERPVTKSGEKTAGLHIFKIKTPADKLSAGMQCTLRFKNLDYPVTIFSFNHETCEISSAVNLKISENDEAVLIIYPWFLYEKLTEGLKSLNNVNSGIELAFTAFGKIKAAAKRESPAVTEKISGIFNSLNDSQRSAIEYSLGSQLSFIWGPPGTGKTFTLSVLISILLERKSKILVVSTTNVAVDTVISKLSELNICNDFFDKGKIVRFGSEHADEQKVNISYILRNLNSLIQKEIDEVSEAVYSLKEDISDLIKIKKELNEGNDQLDLFSEPEQKTPECLYRIDQELSEIWQEIDHNIQYVKISELIDKNQKLLDFLNQKNDSLNEKIIKNPRAAIEQANIVFSTIAGLYSGDLFSGMYFDIVIIEEAGMAVLPAVFYSLSLAREKAILVGDPMQLPPIVNSDQDFAAKAMGRSIYEAGLEEGFNGEHVHLLNIQYRMHPDIGDMVSMLFYGGRLKSGVYANDRAHVTDIMPYPGKAVILHDLKNNSTCMRTEGSYSRYNEYSAEACVNLLNDFPADYTIGIITPYTSQADLIRKQIKNNGMEYLDIECATVHRFQGKEKDIIILDLTDADPLPPGILTSGGDAPNLLNVAVSRAKGKLIVIAEKEYFLKKTGKSKLSELLKYLN